MKQTAVEWVFEQISSSKYFYYLMEDINGRNTVSQSDILDRAKAMEKQQIMDAANSENSVDINYGERYYKETFKSE